MVNNIAESSHNTLLSVLQAIVDNLILEFLPQDLYVKCFSHKYDHIPPWLRKAVDRTVNWGSGGLRAWQKWALSDFKE